MWTRGLRIPPAGLGNLDPRERASPAQEPIPGTSALHPWPGNQFQGRLLLRGGVRDETALPHLRPFGPWQPTAAAAFPTARELNTPCSEVVASQLC